MDNKNTVFAFDKSTTNALKGVFLLLMFVLHFFCFPGYYVDGITLPQTEFMEQFQGNFQICVAGFAFLTGYFYNFAKKKNFKYTLKKWLDLMIPYWFIYAVFMVIGLVTATYVFSVKAFALEIFALKRPIMNFCWYVTFYLISIIALQLLCNIFKNKTILILGFGIFVPIAVYMVAQRITNNEIIIEITSKFQTFFPISIVGYGFSNWNLFVKFNNIKVNKYIKAVIGLLLVLFVFSQPSWMYNFGDNFVVLAVTKIVRIFSIPFFVYGLVLIFDIVPKWLKKPFELIGKQSMLMWFLHCIFFNCSAEIFQPILYFSRIPIVIYLEGIVICLVLSLIVNYPINAIKKIIKI